jgi:hypothetical protein
MPNIRSVKKDVNSLVDNAISECYVTLNFSSSFYYEKIYEILLEVQALRVDYLKKVNQCPQSYTTKQKRLYFSDLMNELMGKTISMVDYLSSVES